MMEVLVVHAREHLNVGDLAPLHYAAFKGHIQICSLLAAQVKPFLMLRYNFRETK